MNVKVNDNANFFHESITVLDYILNNSSPQDNYAEIKEKRGEFSDELQIKLNVIFELFDFVKENLGTVDERLSYLFIEREEFGNKLVTFFLVDKIEFSKEDINFFLKDDKSIQRKLYCFTEIICKQTSFDLEFASEEQFFDYIYSCDFKAETKLDIIKLYLQTEETARLLLVEIERTSNILKEKWKEIKHLVSYTYNELDIKKCDFQNFLAKAKLPISFSNETDLSIYPTIFYFNRIFLYQMKGMDYLFWGINVIDISKMYDLRVYSEEIILDAFKAISDKTKFEILKMLGKERMYNSQIAERVGVTSATASYHLSQLAGIKLVHIEKEANRIYYHLNREMLYTYITQFKDLF